MTLEEFKTSLSEEQIEKLKAVVTKKEQPNKEDSTLLLDYIKQSAEALGDDQIAEPMRYIATSLAGLRAKDLEALIGEDFNSELFEQWVNLLGFPVLVYRELPDNRLYDVAPAMHGFLREEMGDNAFHSCASDIGFYLLEHCEAGDPVRDIQALHLLLDGSETAAVAEYISEVNGEPLRIAVQTLGQALKDAPDYVKEVIYSMPFTQGEKVNVEKLLMLLINDCIAIIQKPQLLEPVINRLHAIVEGLIQQGNDTITILLGMVKLRVAQNYRSMNKQEEAQQAFVAAMNYLMQPLTQADPLSITDKQVRQYWHCLKICQEMVQPKAVSAIFEAIVKVEQVHAQDANRSDEERERVAEDILGQHIDMAKLYYTLPDQLKEQFTNYTEPCVALLKAYLEGAHDAEAASEADNAKLSGYYQSMGELCHHLERYEESYDALVEAQILQMRELGVLQKRDAEKDADGKKFMSPQALIQRLALSVTNHMLGLHYRRQNKMNHDLEVLLKSNYDLATDSFAAYPHDGRVIHFIVNAAIELADFQCQKGGFLAACGTYDKVIAQFPVLNNMRLNQQLCQDIAMIHTKAGQTQSNPKIRRFGDAVRNLETAQRLWKSLADTTKNPEYQKNADAVGNMIKQIKK